MVGRFAVLVDVEAFPFHFLGGTQPHQDIGDLERHERNYGRPYDRDTYALRLYHELVPDGGGADLARDPIGNAGPAERLIVEAFNAEAKKAGWGVRLEQFGPALPDILYKWDGSYFRPALSGAAYVQERWRRLGQRPSPETSLHLHHESAKRNGVLVPALQGPVISKPSDGIGWKISTRRRAAPCRRYVQHQA